MRYLYTLLLYLLVPWVLLRLVWRSWREPGYLQNVGERFGHYRKLAGAPLIWVHAVSVGETRAAQPLIEALLREHPQHFRAGHAHDADRAGGGAGALRRARRALLPALRSSRGGGGDSWITTGRTPGS